jgi:tryptophan 2,3-dioxygenase
MTGSEADAMLNDEMTYDKYLEVKKLLELQKTLTDTSGEMLFIVFHQSTELWLKIVISELREARHRIMMGRSSLAQARGALLRVKNTLVHLVHSWDIIATLSPSDYNAFRSSLGSASGLQSGQFILMELILSRNEHIVRRAESFTSDLEVQAEQVHKELRRPCLYHELINVVGQIYEMVDAHASIDELQGRAQSILERVYVNPELCPAHLYELCEDLVDIEDLLCQWQHRHVTSVKRLIGLGVVGTGGTTGATYLQSLTQVRLFPELWQARVNNVSS